MEPWQTDPNDPRVKALITELAQNQLMREWREKMQAGIAAVARAEADTLRKAQYFRCLGLASGDPEHLEFYAHEVNLEPQIKFQLGLCYFILTIRNSSRNSADNQRDKCRWNTLHHFKAD
jgi:hypothetical protein